LLLIIKNNSYMILNEAKQYQINEKYLKKFVSLN